MNAVGKPWNRILLVLSCLAFLPPGLFAEGIVLRLVDESGSPVANAVLELFPENALPTSVIENVAQIDQIDKEFVPTVTTLVAGGSASFPNSDDILHHVYSFSPAKTFDTPLYGSDASSQYREEFNIPGVVEIGCNIHDWMLAYIYVGESELMAVSDEEGVSSLTNIPAGNYRLRVWHSRLDAPQNFMEQELVIASGGTEELDLSLELVRDRRVRRAPSANRKRYR